MVTSTGQQKRSAHALILLVLVVGLVVPAYAGTLRYDFDNLGDWNVHRICAGGVAPPGPWFVNVENGLLRVKDGGCTFGSATGIYQLESWTDYEIETRIQVRSFPVALGVVLLIRAQWCVVGRECWGGPAGGPVGRGFQGSAYRIWRDNPVDTGQWYDVRIVAKGNRVTYFFDGQKVSEETTDITSGGVAFVTEMGEFWLDYVEITGVDILPVQPQGRLVNCWAALKRS